MTDSLPRGFSSTNCVSWAAGGLPHLIVINRATHWPHHHKKLEWRYFIEDTLMCWIASHLAPTTWVGILGSGLFVVYFTLPAGDIHQLWLQTWGFNWIVTILSVDENQDKLREARCCFGGGQTNNKTATAAAGNSHPTLTRTKITCLPPKTDQIGKFHKTCNTIVDSPEKNRTFFQKLLRVKNWSI